MKYNEATPEVASQGRSIELKIADLRSAYEGLLDPRKNHNKSYSLTSLLVALTAAILCNHLSVLACAEWLADQSSTVKKALGFEDDGGRTP